MNDCRDLTCPAHGRYLRRIRRLQLTLVRERFEHRRRLGRAWTAFLDLVMDARLEDGTPVLEAVLSDPALRSRIEAILRAR